MRSNLGTSLFRLLVLPLVMLTPVAAITNDHLVSLSFSAFTINLYRIISLAASALMAMYCISSSQLIVSRTTIRFIFLGLFWISWGVFSLLWAPDFTEGLREVVVVFFGFCTLITLACLAENIESVFRVLCHGWAAAYLACSAVAAWEIKTDHHLPSYFLQNNIANVEIMSKGRPANTTFVTSTFDNPNDFGCFLVLSLTFILWIFRAASGTKKLILFAVLMTYPFFLVMSESRVAMVAALPQLGYAVLLIARSSGERTSSGLVSKIAVPLLASLLLTCVWYFTIAGNEHTQIKLLSLADEFGDDNLSVGIRIDLLFNGLAFCLRSYGLGIGASGFPLLMERGECPFPTRYIINPHNFLVEVLSQYGVAVFVCFLAAIYGLWRDAKRYVPPAQSNGRGGPGECSQTIFVGMLSYFLASLASSSFIKSPVNWVFLGSLLSLFVHASKSASGNCMHDSCGVTPVHLRRIAQVQLFSIAARRVG